MQTDLQKQFNSVNAELRTLKSNVDNGGENKMDGDIPSGKSRSKGKETKKDPPKKEESTNDTDDDDFNNDIEDRPAPKVNRNSSCDLNPCCLTYVHQHMPTCEKGGAKAKGGKQEKASAKRNVKSRASTVSKGEEECSIDDSDDRPAPKVNRNSSCDLNPCCLTYVHQHKSNV
jgi:hypothetical protein